METQVDVRKLERPNAPQAIITFVLSGLWFYAESNGIGNAEAMILMGAKVVSDLV